MSEVENYFAKLDAPRQELARQIRSIIKEACPLLQEDFKWGKPTYGCKGNVCYISVNTNHINLGFYRGSELSSDAIAIEGTGKNLRHVKIKNGSQPDSAAIARLILDAIRLEEK